MPGMPFFSGSSGPTGSMKSAVIPQFARPLLVFSCCLVRWFSFPCFVFCWIILLKTRILPPFVAPSWVSFALPSALSLSAVCLVFCHLSCLLFLFFAPCFRRSWFTEPLGNKQVENCDRLPFFFLREMNVTSSARTLFSFGHLCTPSQDS